MYNPSDDALAYTNVEYSVETGLMTLYLDGYAPVTNRQNRAISKTLAEMGHNFFEAVFVYGGDTDMPEGRVTRLSWAYGEPARTSDLYRTAAGIDYSGISPTPGQPGQTAGSALLFVGTSADKTLLAVGRLHHVVDVDASGDDVPVSGGMITTATKSVTFEVSSLVAGLLDPTDPTQVVVTSAGTADEAVNITVDAAKSSFVTAAKGIGGHFSPSGQNTWVELKTVGPRQVPYYRLEGTTAGETGGVVNGPQFSAEYTFRGIESYIQAGAIRLAGPGTTDKKDPRFSLNNGTIINPPGELDTHTGVSLLNNNVNTPVAFENPVEFMITPSSGTHNGMIFALVFDVPVYALSGDPDTISGTNAVRWNIRPGFGTFMYDLDTGMNDGGGAIFMGTDAPVAVLDDVGGIVILMPPEKYLYNTSNSAYSQSTGGLIFDVEGLVVQLQDSQGNPYDIEINPETELRYYIGENNEVLIGEPIESSLQGMLPVTVVYVDSNGDRYTATYYILVGDDSRLRIKVKYVANDTGDDNHGDWDRVELTQAGGNYPNATLVLIMATSTNLPEVYLNLGPQRNVLIIAGVPNIRFGRGGDPASIQFNDAGDNRTATGGLSTLRVNQTDDIFFYIGRWPFNAQLVDTFVAANPALAGDQAGNFRFNEPTTGYYNIWYGNDANNNPRGSYDYSINAGGSYQQYQNASTTRPADVDMPQYMFRSAYSVYNRAVVWVGDGLSIRNVDMLYNGADQILKEAD